MLFWIAGFGKCAFLISQNTLLDLRKLEKSQFRRVNKKAHFPTVEPHLRPLRLLAFGYFASARESASGFTQASGVRPHTTSMAFWVQRRRSSTADSSDQ